MTRPTHRRLLAAAALTVLAAPALAQGPEPLDEAIASQTQLAPNQRAAVDAYADGWSEVLQSRESDKREAARKALIEPLGGAPTPAFRIQYGSRLKNVLTRQAAGSSTQRAFAAELAGRLATVDAHAVAVELLADPDPAVRYAAARAARLQLESIDNPPAALSEQHQQRLVSALAQQIAIESNALALDGMLTSASEAVLRDSPIADAVLAAHSAATARNLKSQALEADVVAGARAALRIVTAVQQRYRATNSLAPALAKEGGLLAGSAMSFVLQEIENNPAAEDAAAANALEQLVKAAHNLAFFAASASGVRIQPDNDLPDAFERWRENADARALRSEIEQWIGPGGVITRAPFNADPNDFPALN